MSSQNERNKVLRGAAMEAVNVLMKYPHASIEERIKCLAVAKASLEMMALECQPVDGLPPLPAPAGIIEMNWGTPNAKDVDGYTADQMRGYAIDTMLGGASGPKAPALDYEARHAIMESERNGACEEYFKARPQIDFIGNRRIFEAGFQRGFNAAGDRPSNESD